MIEFWACMGLGCLDKEFLEKLTKANRAGKTVRGVVKEYGFRLSHFELAELEYILGVKEIVENMKNIQPMVCPPPPRPCPTRSASSLQGYREFKAAHLRVQKFLRSKQNR